ncbi:hypothetical protein ACFWIB_14845 [Streptomyces sp. NPDC127051]|uniref:hypothetical protein n=1 Tax=Streptomyces sp. NPDC127051 TaxID=3347119 RepID=UPI00365FA45E
MFAATADLSIAWPVAYAFARSQLANEPTASCWANHVAETGTTHEAADQFAYRQWFDDMCDQARRLIADLDALASA